MFDPKADVSVSLLLEIRELLSVLGRFWGGIEVDINPDFDGVHVNRDAIQSGSMLMMDYLIGAADPGVLEGR